VLQETQYLEDKTDGRIITSKSNKIAEGNTA
jgi:hypothetical protein